MSTAPASLRPAPSPLRLARTRLGITLWEVALGIGSYESALSRLERGQLTDPALERKVRAFLAAQREKRA